METPSSTRRVTRSQTMASATKNTTNNANISRKSEESEKGFSKSKQRTSTKQDRSVLIDITNDSPIVGLASGNLETPISSVTKQRSIRCKRTPGSGEALLRGQVKNLLQKVEEEAEISKFSLPSDGLSRRHGLKALLNSPAGLLAPTPANTPLILNFSAGDEVESFGSVSPSPIVDQLNISQVVSGIIDGMKQGESGSESEKDLISRSLFLDFSEKSEVSSDCSSVVTYQGVEIESQGKPGAVEDDDASIWSIQVNASTRGEDEDEDEVIEDDVGENDGDVYEDGDDYGEEEESDLLLDDLCEGISNINVNGEKGVTFMGKHKRFVYNSDDELVEEHEDGAEEDSAEVLRLKGLPTPKGKHLRFQDEEGDEQ